MNVMSIRLFRRTLPAFAMTLAITFALTTTASGQDDRRTNEARSLYDAGAVAFGDGRFEDALRRWQESYTISEHPALLYNIGIAHDRLGQVAEAVEAYDAYLAAVPDATNANYTQSRLAILRQQLADTTQATDAQGHNGAEDDGEAGSPSDPERERPAVVAEAPDDSETPSTGGSNAGPIALLIGGGVALAAGIGVAVVADSQYADLEATCPGGICPAGSQGDIDSLGGLTLTADLLMAAGSAAALGGLVWLLVDGSEEEETAVQLGIVPGGVTLQGVF